MARDKHNGVSEQAKASQHRLDDARVLLKAARWRGAMYIAGYSVECLLKAKLMRMFDCHHLRELEDELERRGALPTRTTVYTHELEILLRWTHRIDQLRRDRGMWPQFAIVNGWVPAWRYSADRSNPEDANDFLDAVDKIRHWIEHNV